MKHGKKVKFLKTIKRPNIKQINGKFKNLSNNQAAYGKYKDYPYTYPLYIAFAREWREYGCTGIADVLPTRGAEEALKMIFSAYVDAGSTVLRADPVFGMIPYFEEINRAKVEKIDYVNLTIPISSKAYINKINELKDEISLIYLAIPDNPTGLALEPNELDSILKTAKFFNIPVVVDCAYLRFLNETYYMVLNINKYSNLIIVDSLSKSHGLAGLRVGAIIAKEEMIKPMRALRPINEVSSVAVKVAVKALKSNIAKKNRYHANYWKMKFRRTFPGEFIYSDCNFILLKYCDEKHIYFYHKLYSKKILTRIKFDHPVMSNILRISIGDGKTMRRVLRILKE